MMQAPKFLIGKHPNRGLLWAAVDPNARFTGSELGETRFAGYLRPYCDEQSARDALTAAGATNIEAEQRRRGR
ncbi:hypothetical protein ACUXST_000148 [Sphingomonas sp. F9_3S_D5_B_2]